MHWRMSSVCIKQETQHDQLCHTYALLLVYCSFTTPASSTCTAQLQQVTDLDAPSRVSSGDVVLDILVHPTLSKAAAKKSGTKRHTLLLTTDAMAVTMNVLITNPCRRGAESGREPQYCMVVLQQICVKATLLYIASHAVAKWLT